MNASTADYPDSDALTPTQLAKQLSRVTDGLLTRYNTSGPRYTSYPTAPVWTTDFDARAFRYVLESSRETQTGNTPLALYTHIPFCEERCLFCGCNVVITKQKHQAETYLSHLFKEIDLACEWMAPQRPVFQLHWGGGTPTYLTTEQMTRLFQHLKDRFQIQADAEIALEVDPRVTTTEQVTALRALGFNRISLGVQDFNPAVQEAIHRVQSTEMTETLMETCRALGYQGINLDLIYGLPYQTTETFQQTLSTVIRLNPDRIALYNYAHVPWMAPHQKQIPEDALPPGPVKFEIFRTALQRLTEAGYVYIGMDHFARPTDELAQALTAGTLHRNFMGYTVHSGLKTNTVTELHGFGVSAISGYSAHYAQNVKKLSDYYEALERKQLPTWRGYGLSQDDLIRRSVIQQILCRGQLLYEATAEAFQLEVPTYFADSLRRLAPMAEDGLVRLTEDGLYLTVLGRIFARNVAMHFDAYLKPEQTGAQPIFSKTL